jgi:hypothetical protein
MSAFFTVHIVIGTQKFMREIPSFATAPEGWRTPRRFAFFKNHRSAHSVLDCGGPPPLFPQANQTVPMSNVTARDYARRVEVPK